MIWWEGISFPQRTETLEKIAKPKLGTSEVVASLSILF